ncbi:hypothetical protein CK203_027530 [Vitis vinifera]|uniref:Retrotransposon gag domain-containing protein n=1 Tax=Vitis vinifera TaxID=29760 RepID=A0A438JB42_VITVI|nr:hypothetical protein CK203_027530 [Vitis vinifera]
MATPSRSRSSSRGEDDNFEWCQTIERRQLASERPPRRQHSRGQVANLRPQQEPESIYPRTTGAILGACNVRPHEPHTPMPRAPREESLDSTHFSAKRQSDRRPQLSNSMGARLGPQEPGRPRPPVATTWAPRPDPMVTPMVQNVHPHRDPMVTPVMRNVHSHPAVQQAGGNLPNEPPIGSISRSWMTCSPRPSALISFITSPQGDSSDLSEAFVGQYLCSARHKQNISTLQNIKMQDNESLREFVKRFGQAVLQVEACSMDAVLQIFKRSICLGTPFFESLAKKPPTTMDDLFRRASKYSMLEDDVRAATQQVMVAGQAARGSAKRNAKPPDRPRPSD